jgi:hypothetical protein
MCETLGIARDNVNQITRADFKRTCGTLGINRDNIKTVTWPDFEGNIHGILRIVFPCCSAIKIQVDSSYEASVL